jgi:uncharacterized protein (DUF488 family)
VSTIRTVGHGTLEASAFVDLLRGAGVETVVDVRRHPGSRRHPQFGRDAMEGWLGEAGLGYEWRPELGGRRKPEPDSPNVALRNEQFRGYADHMATADFRAGVEGLRSRSGPVVVMCAEALWWHCHRRLMADHLVLVEGDAVEHLFHDGRLVRHDPTPEARRERGRVVYDRGGQPTLFGP